MAKNTDDKDLGICKPALDDLSIIGEQIKNATFESVVEATTVWVINVAGKWGYLRGQLDRILRNYLPALSRRLDYDSVIDAVHDLTRGKQQRILGERQAEAANHARIKMANQLAFANIKAIAQRYVNKEVGLADAMFDIVYELGIEPREALTEGD